MKRTTQITLDALLTPSLLLPGGRGRAISALLNRSEVKKYLFYSYGRTALLDGIKILDCEKGNNILLPAYICRVAVEPFRELGIEPRFYEVSLNLQPDTIDIKKKIDKNTKGLLIVNYFGFTQDINEIKNICRKYGLYLIEDNAHGFLSKQDSRLLGTFGDIGFSSIWKNLPVPNGALLFINNEELLAGKERIERLLVSQNQHAKMSKKRLYTYILNSLLCNFELRYGFRAEFVRKVYRKMVPRVDLNGNQMLQGAKVKISNISLRVINKIDLEDVHKKRRQNYKFWLRELHNRKDVHFIFEELPDGVCPLCFAVIEKEADGFSREMLAKGIQAFHWPPLPKEIKDNPEYPNTNFLAKHIVLLPMHQSLDQNCLKRVVRE